MNTELKNIVEVLMMVADAPLSVARIQSVFESTAAPPADEIKAAIEALQEDCAERGIEVRKIGNGYRFQTRPHYAQWLRKLHASRPPRMSRAQLEVLAIVAYRQPVTRGDIEEIRGVAVSADIMQRLLEREWIKQVGVRDVPGRPALFATTAEFLSYFNLASLKELPPLSEQREFSAIARDLEMPLPAELLATLEGETTGVADADADADEPAQDAPIAGTEQAE